MQSKYIPPLSAKAVVALPLGTHNVGGVPGLYLRKLHNKAFFYLRYSDGGKRRDFYLGSYLKLSLAQARIKASTAKSLNEQGISPVETARKKRKIEAQVKEKLHTPRKTLTFEKVARDWIHERVNAGFWCDNRRGESNTVHLLELYAFPVIGTLSIDTIQSEHIRDCLSPI